MGLYKSLKSATYTNLNLPLSVYDDDNFNLFLKSKLIIAIAVIKLSIWPQKLSTDRLAV